MAPLFGAPSDARHALALPPPPLQARLHAFSPRRLTPMALLPCAPVPPSPRCSGFASSALPQPAPKGTAAPAAEASRTAAPVQAPAIDVQRYVRDNITPYDGDASFLSGPTPRTLALWEQVQVGARRAAGRAGAWLPPAGGMPRGMPPGGSRLTLSRHSAAPGLPMDFNSQTQPFLASSAPAAPSMPPNLQCPPSPPPPCRLSVPRS